MKIDMDLERIRTWQVISNENALRELIEFVESIWNRDYGRVVHGTRAGCVEFLTGGWADNEAIIGALQQNSLAWSMAWQLSERGGRHIFCKVMS